MVEEIILMSLINCFYMFFDNEIKPLYYILIYISTEYLYPGFFVFVFGFFVIHDDYEKNELYKKNHSISIRVTA